MNNVPDIAETLIVICFEKFFGLLLLTVISYYVGKQTQTLDFVTKASLLDWGRI